MRDRTPGAPRLEWPGGIVPEWAKTPEGARKKRGAGAKGGGKRERLQKVMAQSGYGSRRNVEILIAQGHLTINGQVAKLGDLVGPGDKVKLDGATISIRFGEAMPRVMLYHKPEGEIVTRDDPQGRATVFEKLPRVNGGRWVSVGRLDINTGGLLIFTTSGELANRLTHPRFEVEREYAVRLLGPLTDEARAKLLAGVELDGAAAGNDRTAREDGRGRNRPGPAPAARRSRVPLRAGDARGTRSARGRRSRAAAEPIAAGAVSRAPRAVVRAHRAAGHHRIPRADARRARSLPARPPGQRHGARVPPASS